MKGLLIKDICNLKKYSKTVFVILTFYVLYGVMMNNSSFISGMIILLFSMMAITSFSYDDLAKWDKYALSLPITRKEMVLSKYLLALILAVLGSLTSFLAALFFTFIKMPVDMEEQLIITYVVFAIAILFLSVMLPLIYKFGVEKSRMMIFIVFGIPTAAFFVLANIGFKLPTEAQLISMLYYSPIALIAMFIISYFISYSFFSKRDL